MNIEKLLSDHEGYKTKFVSGDWRIGLITPADRFQNITYLERHNETDEVFILLKGSATIIGFDSGIKTETVLEEGNIYNVPKAMWHNVKIDDGSVVAVVENSDTSNDNSEYMEFKI